ncbi:MAG: hypothetical protein P9L99_04195 [Candidatus Lernaella stagnicola]|nr:hypothetical protein [Candidatus Lernaella stagnicola]
MPKLIALTLATLLLAALIVGCATVTPRPEISESQVKKTLDAARFSGAELKSPYEFYSAEFYYQRAIAERSQGNLATARKNLQKAYEMARTAYENARKFRKAK